MTPHEIERIVERELSSYRYEGPEPGSTIGVPWSEAMVQSHIEILKRSLVTPYQQRFLIKDTAEQIDLNPPNEMVYWVVAKTDEYLEFFDPETNEFGLACFGVGESLPSTISVRGDLIGTFCAM